MEELKKTIQKQNDRIALLEARICELKTKSEGENSDSSKESSRLRDMIRHSDKEIDQSKSSLVRKGNFSH